MPAEKPADFMALLRALKSPHKTFISPINLEIDEKLVALRNYKGGPGPSIEVESAAPISVVVPAKPSKDPFLPKNAEAA